MTSQEPQPQWNAGSPAPRSTNMRWGTLAVIVGAIVLASYVFGDRGSSPSPTPRDNGGGGPPPPTTVVVVYQLTGSASSADLTYTDGSGNIQQQSGVAVPLTTTSGANGISFRVERGSFVSFSAQNQGESGDLTCKIVVNGEVLNTGHSSGGYTIVTCSARIP